MDSAGPGLTTVAGSGSVKDRKFLTIQQLSAFQRHCSTE